MGKSELNQPNRKPLERKNKAQDEDYIQKRQTRQKHQTGLVKIILASLRKTVSRLLIKNAEHDCIKINKYRNMWLG